MSEAERIRRADYRRRRSLALTVLTIALAAVTLVTAGFGIALNRLSETLYIDYTEEGSVDYQVALRPNDFYESDLLPSGQAYVASLIDGVTTNFRYRLKTEASNVEYEYSYWLDTRLEILERNTKNAIYNPTFPIKEKQTLTQKSGSQLYIVEAAEIDYAQYNELAARFIKTYGLSNVECRLVARMHISVLSLCDDFRQNAQNEYVITLNIPLTTQTVNIEMSSSVPNTESKILACENTFNRGLFRTVVIVGACLAAALLIALVATLLLTRSEDITYTSKVKRILSTYRSFIQLILAPFETGDRQVVHVSSFRELLEIRDTITAPILMYENTDKTCTQFMIPANASLLYLYELKVADYDDLYGLHTATDAFADAKTAAGSFSAHGEPRFDSIGDFTFEALLALAKGKARTYHDEILAFADAFGAKVIKDRAHECICHGQKIFALIAFHERRPVLAFTKDPSAFDNACRVMDMSSYAQIVPLSSRRKLRIATDILCQRFISAGLIAKSLSRTSDDAEDGTAQGTTLPKK